MKNWEQITFSKELCFSLFLLLFFPWIFIFKHKNMNKKKILFIHSYGWKFIAHGYLKYSNQLINNCAFWKIFLSFLMQYEILLRSLWIFGWVEEVWIFNFFYTFWYISKKENWKLIRIRTKKYTSQIHIKIHMEMYWY
jgi:hypothetical protein